MFVYAIQLHTKTRENITYLFQLDLDKLVVVNVLKCIQSRVSQMDSNHE